MFGSERPINPFWRNHMSHTHQPTPAQYPAAGKPGGGGVDPSHLPLDRDTYLALIGPGPVDDAPGFDRIMASFDDEAPGVAPSAD